MKRVGLLLLVLTIIICAVGCGSDNPTIDLTYPDEESYIYISSEESSSEESSSEEVSSLEEVSSTEDVSSVPTQTDIPVDSWELALVNNTNPLPEGYMPELSQIKTKYASEDSRFDSRAVDMLNQMCDAAYEDGIWLWIVSAWRSNARQTHNFNREVNEALAQNPGMSKEDAEKIAATEVARPGTSEHQLGLAVDINSVEETFKETKQYAWLQEHAHEYGFIMRYTEEKQPITGVIYEPWHYRYVGVENAAAIKDSGLCLEEYLAAH